MLFFSGFGFRAEKALFREYLDSGEFVIAGFSRGAQRALVEALQKIERGERLQKLQLLATAYFDYLPKAAKHKEILTFAKNPEAYMRFFYKKAAYPAMLDLAPFKAQPTLGELKELLLFSWDGSKLARLRDLGVEIEVYLGEYDTIVDSKKCAAFFKPYATIYIIRGAGHLLRGKDG